MPLPLSKIVNNDPLLVDLVVDCSCDYFPRKRKDWERLGRALGGNTFIKNLSLVSLPAASYEQEVRTGIGMSIMSRFMAKNRCINTLSIENLVYTTDTSSKGDVFFMCLAKFMRDNRSLVRIELKALSTSEDLHYHMLSRGISASNSLECFMIQDTQLGHPSFCVLAQACKSNLRRLCLINSNINFRRIQLLVGSWVLDKVSLRIRLFQFNLLTNLSLYPTSGQNTPTHLDLGYNEDINEESCAELALLPVLPKYIKLNSCSIGNRGVRALFPRFGAETSRIKMLTLRNTGIGLSACKTLSRVLMREDNRIRILDLAENNLCDQSVSTLVRALKKNTSLRHLNLMWNPGLTSDVTWGGFIGLLGGNAVINELKDANHTLIKVSARSQYSCMGLQVKTLLYMNSLSRDSRNVQREKMKRFHLMNAYRNGGFLSKGGDVESAIMPDLLGWIGSDGTHITSGCSLPRVSASLSAFFYLLKHNPWMFGKGLFNGSHLCARDGAVFQRTRSKLATHFLAR